MRISYAWCINCSADLLKYQVNDKRYVYYCDNPKCSRRGMLGTVIKTGDEEALDINAVS